ncbi:MAG: Asp23/Gls24 family envelope stress response protein [Bacilli bacterium]|nr:Asp23/Gls24 family envelope stress response protein [Bacilli bacterium]
MLTDKPTPYGEIHISIETIAAVAGQAAMECYGVLGLSKKNNLRENINELLKKDDFKKGVYCTKKKDGYEIEVYLTVAYGVKITEVISEVQKKIKFDLEKTFHISFNQVNVFVQDIKEI